MAPPLPITGPNKESNNMKKTRYLALSLAALTLTACGGGSSSAPSSSSSAPAHSGSALPYDPYVPSIPSHEPSTNAEVFDYDAIKVNGPAKPLADGFAFGADLSIVAEVEKYGGIYYNEQGQEQDIFAILKNDGVNYCRLRLWNDPYSEDGLPYGGGTNDLATDIYLAKRAQDAGMKVLIDFHYSDHWADPAKFHAPKEWAKRAYAGNITRFMGDYTYGALKAFKEAGVTVDSVQIGNESNNGLAGFSTLSAMDLVAEMVHAGVDAAKEVFPNIKTLVHLSNVKTPSSVYQFLDALKEEEVPYDIVGLSYYAYLHGTKENLLNVMNTIHDNYAKPSWVVETSYGFTDEDPGYGGNSYNGANHEVPGGYLTSVQGQTTQMADLVSTLSEVKESYGQGVFYWEPAWIPAIGSTWATKAGQYYNTHGSDGTEEEIAVYTDKSCEPSWSNQGWFSYSGKATPSASVYKHIQALDKKANESVIGARTNKVSVNVNLLKGVELPKTAQVVTSFDALRARPVVWDEEEIAAITRDGEYKVHGVILKDYEVDAQGHYVYDEEDTYPITASVVAETNYIPDYSFEKQGAGEEVPVAGDWEVESLVAGACRIEAKSEGNIDGEKYFHWFSDAENEFTLKSKITVANPDDYDLSTYVMAGDLKSDYDTFEMWYQIGEESPVYVNFIDKLKYGWGILELTMQRIVIEHIEIEEANTLFSFGLHVKYKGSAWGHNDLWSFAKHKDAKAEYVAQGALEDGDLAEQTVGGPLVDPWILDEGSSGFKVGNEAIGSAVSKKNFAWWLDSDFSFGFHQNIAGLEAGTYSLLFATVSESSEKYVSYLFSVLVDGEAIFTYDIKANYALGWKEAGETIRIDGIEVPADKTITLSIKAECLSGCWGRVTDFALTK